MCPKTVRHSRARGLLLTEAVISLAICAALLTAVAAGFVAASNAIKTNDEFSRATQTARVMLVQFEDQVRTGCPDSTFTTDAQGNITTFRVRLANGTYRTYTYNSTAKTFVAYMNATGTGTAYVMARNVTTCKLSAATGTDANGLGCVTQATMTLTVTVGKNSITLSGSAAPRMSLTK